MRRLYAILIAAGFVYMMLSFLGVVPGYGNIDLCSRVSSSFLLKDVSEQNAKNWLMAKGLETKSIEKVYGEKNKEDGCANVVTSIVVNYRSFDTLGEVTVLFTAALGVGLILGGTRRKKYGLLPNFVFRESTRILVPLIILFGAYIFVHGHLTPGGGFPGGTIIAAAALLLYLADEEFFLSKVSTGALEGSMGGLYVIAGLLGLAIGGYFLYNFLPTGRVGNLISSGIVPIVYTFIGLKVGAELSGLITDLHSEEG